MSAQRHGWILTLDGNRHPVPEFLLDEEEVKWPPGMPQVRPGQRTPLISQEDFYRRHELVEGEVYLFLRYDQTPDEVPPEVIQELLGGR